MRGALALCFALAFGLVLAGPETAFAARKKRPDPVETALRQHIEVLASDEFDGREPGTEGETLTLRYLAREWFDMGMISGTNLPGKDWFAPVELVERAPLSSRATFQRGKRRLMVPENSVWVVTSGLKAVVEPSPVLFVGHARGPLPPRTDLAGRVALILDGAADPAGPPDRAGALLDAGAAAVITVLDGDQALESVRARRERAGYALSGDGTGGDIEAFVSPAGLAALLPAGSDLAKMQAEAAAPGFAPRVLNFTASLEATTRETRIRTHNLIGRIPGRVPNSGAVLLVAHWDHFGECAEAPAEDLICNGAIDNASGVAVITEVARAIVEGRQLDRDVYVLATTGEELGLLGAKAFAENPPLPLERIVAAFNVDSVGLVGRGLPLTIIGRGMTGLDTGIEAVARKMKRKIVQNDAANIYVRRQDIWALMQHDVPTVMVSSAYSDPERLERFMEDTYHRPGDQPGGLELGGASEDVAFHIELVRYFGTIRNWPAGGGKAGPTP